MNQSMDAQKDLKQVKLRIAAGVSYHRCHKKQFYALELGKSGVVAALIVNNVLSSLTNDVCSKHDYCKHIRFSCIVSAFHVGWSYSSLKPLEQIQLL
ncbi:hypothetical protein ACS0TY_003701 [Phlomoides rotata]